MQGTDIRLERLRTEEGEARCREVFEQVCRQNRYRASMLLNDSQLTFPTLFLLYPQIQPRKQYLRLNQRGRQLIYILSEIEKDHSGNGKLPMLARKNRMTHDILLWAVRTGYRYDGSDQYDTAMDLFICVLLTSYRETQVLPYTEHLIFERNREGKNLHDLIWAYFHLHDPVVLRRMSEHLRAKDPLEVELARALLGTEEICPDCRDGQAQCNSYQKWLSENDPYLFFTEENLQYARNPEICRVDESRKFLQKSTDDYEPHPLEHLSEKEADRLKEFKKLDRKDRHLVCCFSQNIRKRDPAAWRDFMDASMDKKLDQAKTEMGDLV